MSAHASRISTDTADGSARHAAGSIFASMNRGASEIQTRVSEALPATGRFLGRAVYRTSYAVSFGMSFPVMMVVRMMPKNNAMVHGLVDGALAARDRVHEWGPEAIGVDSHESTSEAHHAEANGSAHHGHAHKPEQATRRRAKPKRASTAAAAPRKTTTKASSRKKS
jgi:hypothetical protein